MSQDKITLFAYIVVSFINLSAGSMLALLVMVIVTYTSTVLSFVYPIDDVYLFLVLGVAYLTLSKYLRDTKDIAWAGCAFMSLYCLYYSFDSWINAEYETWIWQNHEVIIASAHAFIMLLLSKARFAMVFTCFYILWCGDCSIKNKECSQDID